MLLFVEFRKQALAILLVLIIYMHPMFWLECCCINDTLPKCTLFTRQLSFALSGPHCTSALVYLSHVVRGRPWRLQWIYWSKFYALMTSWWSWLESTKGNGVTSLKRKKKQDRNYQFLWQWRCLYVWI